MRETAFGVLLARRLRDQKLAPSTIKVYVSYVVRFRSFLASQGRRIERTTLDDIHEFATTLPQTYASLSNFQNAFKAYWRCYLGKSIASPAERLLVPSKPEMVWRGIEKEEAFAVIDAASYMGPRERAVCSLLYFAGLRNHEAARLKVNALKDDLLYVVGKGLKTRIVPAEPELIEALTAAVPEIETEWHFPGRNPGSPISTNTVNVWVALASMKGLGYKITPHQLRHTFGGVLVDQTGDLRAAGELLGHSKKSIDITAGYSRSKIQRKKEMIASLGRPSAPEPPP